ncbi:hypothetical protein [Streptomyces sp. A1136]|uniref:hypothetical protein n=1 Tax=Streptomyces sp. A1136 TaxID=2563102 RepID=UPI00109E4EA9|nr:hypothetical protein [Streptomyces sp. A1136]THA57823.1 hypothetical protein E6R62_04815 [Streptomyces sp. A1136]
MNLGARARHIGPDAVIVSLMKGIESGTGLREAARAAVAMGAHPVTLAGPAGSLSQRAAKPEH